MKYIYRTIHFLVTLALMLSLLPTAQTAQAKPEALLVSDASVTMLADIHPGLGNSFNYEPTVSVAAPLGSNVVFLASSPEHGMEPWITNGTPAGTKMIKDTFPGSTGVYVPLNNLPPAEPVYWKGKVFFVGQGRDVNGVIVPQLWVTNGTAEGTLPVLRDPLPIAQFVAGTQGVMFLTKFIDPDTQISESSVWWTDGTPQGTRILCYSYSKSSFRDIQPLGQYAFLITPERTLLRIDSANTKNAVILADNMFNVLGAANGLLFFSRETPANGQELWQTNGTVSGTTMVADMSPAALSTYIYEALVIGSKLVFIAGVSLPDRDWSKGVFTTTGKAGGITTIQSTKFGDFRDLQQQGDTLFYRHSPTYQTGYTEWQLWYSAGSMAPKQVCPTCLFNPYTGIGGLPGEIIFSADGELWNSNFTDNGTRRITGVRGSYTSAVPSNFVSTNGYVFFIARSKEKGVEPHVYRKVASPIVALPDNFEAMAGAVHKFDVLANDSHQGSKPLMLVSFDENGSRGGMVTLDDRGTRNDRTDDRLIYQLPYHNDYVVDELHYWVEDADGNRMSARVSIAIVPLEPLPPEDIKYISYMPLRENMHINTYIGHIEVFDPSPYEYNHACSSSPPDSPIQIMDNRVLYVNGSVDYETNPNGFVIRITCTDPTNLSYTEDIHLPVVNENEPPELTVPSNQTVAEDSQQELGQVSWRDPENNTNSVRPTAAFGSTSLTGCANGACMLLYQPAANYVGNDTITVKATDQGGLSTEQVITVTVTAGNDDPPVMKPVGTIIRYSGIEAHQIGLEGIAAGPYETGPVTMTVSTDIPAMLVDLAVDYTEGPVGILTFTLHPEEGSEALVTITLSDGENETEYTFNVIVTDNPPLYLPVIGR